MDNTIKLARTKPYLKISTDGAHSPHSEFTWAKGNSIKRGKSQTDCAKGVFHQVCLPGNINLGQEWISAPSNFKVALSKLHSTKDAENILVLQ